MNNNKATWYKWDYVCSGCDAHVEITALVDGHSIKNEMCMKCLSPLTLVSVVDVTIPNVTQKKEEEMITETPAQTMTLDWVENDLVKTVEYTESDVRHMVWQNKNLNNKQNEWYTKESQLRTLLEEVYADSNEQETLAKIAEMFDVPLTKEISVTAYVRVDMTIEVDMADGEYYIEDMVLNNLTVDSFGSDISVNNYDVERVEEGAY
jgi:DUF4097 and DUF4098 domain-containing protein YvlB